MPAVQEHCDRGILVTVNAMRPARQVGRTILTALEAIRRSRTGAPVSHPGPAGLATLGEAFGAPGPGRASS